MDEPGLREQLRTVDEELRELRRTAAQLRAQIGGRSDGAVDLEDSASAITGAEEQEALIAALEVRREGLLKRLG